MHKNGAHNQKGMLSVMINVLKTRIKIPLARLVD